MDRRENPHRQTPYFRPVRFLIDPIPCQLPSNYVVPQFRIEHTHRELLTSPCSHIQHNRQASKSRAVCRAIISLSNRIFEESMGRLPFHVNEM